MMYSVLIGSISAEFSPAVASAYTQYDDLDDLTPVAGWGMILRNPAYTGPALRVEDNSNPGTTTDVDFTDGIVTGTLPYGADSRVVIVYDQWGTEDLTALYTQNITLVRETGSFPGFSSWRIVFNGTNGGLLSPTNTGSGAAWEITRPVVTSGFRRTSNSGLQLMWGVQSGSNFMEMGLWQEGADLHWRVNGSSPLDWTGTNWTTNSALVQDTLSRLIQDYSNQSSPAEAFMNNVSAGTRSFTYPIAFSSGYPLGIGDWGGVGNPFQGDFMELHMMDPGSVDLSSANRTILDDATAELLALDAPAEPVITVFEQVAYTIEGSFVTDAETVHAQVVYVLEASPLTNAIAAAEQTLYVIETP